MQRGVEVYIFLTCKLPFSSPYNGAHQGFDEIAIEEENNLPRETVPENKKIYRYNFYKHHDKEPKFRVTNIVKLDVPSS